MSSIDASLSQAGTSPVFSDAPSLATGVSALEPSSSSGLAPSVATAETVQPNLNRIESGFAVTNDKLEQIVNILRSISDAITNMSLHTNATEQDTEPLTLASHQAAADNPIEASTTDASSGESSMLPANSIEDAHGTSSTVSMVMEGPPIASVDAAPEVIAVVMDDNLTQAAGEGIEPTDNQRPAQAGGLSDFTAQYIRDIIRRALNGRDGQSSSGAISIPAASVLETSMAPAVPAN